jgi:DNA-directed RNA polymerase specialized sigma24 family protein
MNPAKIDPNSIATIREKGVESIVDWFEQHKQSFYILGWSYLSSQQQMEELFYRAIIKGHKEWHRIKSKTSFEMEVTSIFIHTCRELYNDRSLQASEESESRQGVFKALDQLKEHEALVLTYVKRFSHEESAHLLQVTVAKIKELLFSGIQSLRNEMNYGSTFNGCKEYHKDYIDYLERKLDRSKKIDLEVHIYHCQNCQEDLATFQDVMLTISDLTDRMEDLHVPSGFIENVKARLAVDENRRQQKNKKRKKMGSVLASVFAFVLGIGFFTGAFTNLYYTWTEEDLELRVFLQQDLGERLNIEAESDGVKIKIKSAIADDIQTLVFYEIIDTKEDNQYVMDFHNGVYIENQHEIMSNLANPMYYLPDFESDINKEEKNVFKGKISLPPLKTDNGTIKLKITKLQKLVRDSSNQNIMNTEEAIGEWNFEIPVSKKPSTEYALDEEIEIEGIPVRFKKLTIAPTATTLQYGINTEQAEKRIDVINFDNLEVNNKKLKADVFGRSFVDSAQQEMNWYTFQNRFDPLIGEKPKEVNVQFGSVHLTFEDQKTIELDATQKYPQTFEYAGSTISIDKVEVGQPTTVVISNHDIENRAYDMLQFNIVGEDENGNETGSMEMNSEGVIIDKNGIKYDLNEIPFPFEKIERPRYFITVQNMKLHGNNSGEKVMPKRLEFYGYNTTKYLDNVVKISLE